MIDLFTLQRPTLSLTELSKGFGMGKGSTYRYALSLRQCGLLSYNPISQRYGLGSSFLRLVRNTSASVRLIYPALVPMEALANSVGETAILTVWDGTNPLVVHVVEPSNRAIYYHMRIGTRLRVDGVWASIFQAHMAEDPTLEQKSLRSKRVVVRAANSVEALRVLISPIFVGPDVVALMGIAGAEAAIPNTATSRYARGVRLAAEELTAALNRDAEVAPFPDGRPVARPQGDARPARARSLI
jgi:DNA-binding IclR family transcriptional regulator